MRTDELDFPLPDELIATRPAEPRDSARLLVARRASGTIEHHVVRDLPDLLERGDLMVFNTAAVLPARIVARRTSGGRVEGLALAPAPAPQEGLWRVLLRGSGRLHPGERLALEHDDGGETGDSIELVARDEEAWLARFVGQGPAPEILGRSGWTPLPPYILRARAARARAGAALPGDEQDRRWYETIFADARRRRSVAAPTAGLHFTPSLLERLRAAGVRRADVTLDVGEGTFRPVTAGTLEAHAMHRERFEVSAATLEAIRAQRSSGGRIVAVGTTSVRALESLPDPLPEPTAEGISAETGIMIAPGHRFRHVDALLTNFHLPRSTLLALVAALTGLPWLKEIYAEAAARGYRFLSYGDAMLVL